MSGGQISNYDKLGGREFGVVSAILNPQGPGNGEVPTMEEHVVQAVAARKRGSVMAQGGMRQGCQQRSCKIQHHNGDIPSPHSLMYSVVPGMGSVQRR